MAVIGQAFVEILPQTSAFAGKLSKDVGEAVEQTSSRTSGAFDKLGKVGAAALTGIATTAVSVGVEAVHLADHFEEAHARLVTAVTNSGASYEGFAKQIAAADKSNEKFGLTADQTEGALARLTQSTNNPKKSMDELAVAVNLAAARHIDLETAATLVGKAGEGNVTSLKKLGITLDVTGTSAEKGAQAMKALSERFGGSAAAQADTFQGKIAAVKAQAEDLGAKLGLVLIPIIEKLASAVFSVVEWLEKHRAVAEALAAVVGGVLVAAIAAFVAGLSPVILIAAGVTAAIAGLTAGVEYAYTHWGFFHDAVDKVVQVMRDDVWPIIQKVADFLEAHWKPILIAVTVAVVGLVAPLALVAAGAVYLYEKFGIVRDIVDTVARILRDVFVVAVDTAVLIIGNLIDTVKVVTRVIGDVVDIVTDIFTGKWGAAWEAFKDIPAAIIEFVKGLLHGWIDWFRSVPALIIDALSSLGGLLVRLATDALGALIHGAEVGAVDVAAWFAKLPGRIVGWLGDLGGWLIGKGRDLLAGLGAGIVAAAGDIKNWVIALPDNIVKWMPDVSKTLVNLGKQLIGGLLDGIKATAGSIGSVVGDAIDALPGGHAARKLLGLATGGFVPGPVGAPMLAVVHGGEFVLSRDMLAGRAPITASVSSRAASGPVSITFGDITVGDGVTVEQVRNVFRTEIASVLGGVLDRAAAGAGARHA